MQQFIPKPDWSKIGPGIGVDFDATPTEIQTIFENSLLNEYGPYEWLKFESIWQGDRVIGRTWSSIEISDTARFLTSSITEKGQRFEIYLRSYQLNPNPDWAAWKFSDDFCAIGGMPRFHRYCRVSESVPYRLGMVWKVGNIEQTEVIEHHEYRRVFKALRRQFKKFKK